MCTLHVFISKPNMCHCSVRGASWACLVPLVCPGAPGDEVSTLYQSRHHCLHPQITKALKEAKLTLCFQSFLFYCLSVFYLVLYTLSLDSLIERRLVSRPPTLAPCPLFTPIWPQTYPLFNLPGPTTQPLDLHLQQNPWTSTYNTTP